MPKPAASPRFDGEYAEIFGHLGDMPVPRLPSNAKEKSLHKDLQLYFRVSFVLAPPGMYISEGVWTIGSDSGDSFLMLADAEGNSLQGYSVRPNTQIPIHFYLMENEFGRLGRITSDDFQAESIQAALGWSNDSINLVLSSISVFTDVPLHVRQIEVIDLKNKIFWSRRVLPFRTRGIGFRSIAQISDELRLFSNLYREALNSSSEAYRFLCLYKLLEALLNSRGTRAKKAKKSGSEPRIYQEIIPELEEEQIRFLDDISIFADWRSETLEQIFPPLYRGWKFRRMLNEMRQTRDKVAHGLMDNGMLGLSTDPLVVSRQISLWLPILRILCRKVLQEDFAMCS